jgi:hypothetical protein
MSMTILWNCCGLYLPFESLHLTNGGIRGSLERVSVNRWSLISIAASK